MVSRSGKACGRCYHLLRDVLELHVGTESFGRCSGKLVAGAKHGTCSALLLVLDKQRNGLRELTCDDHHLPAMLVVKAVLALTSKHMSGDLGDILASKSAGNSGSDSRVIHTPKATGANL